MNIESESAEIFARIQPATDEQIRARAWHEDILPRLERCQVPERHRYELRSEADWNCPHQFRVFKVCQNLFTHTGAIVALVGERGTGKTALAAQLIIARLWREWERLNDPQTVGFCWPVQSYRLMADLIARFKSIYSDSGSIETDRLMNARTAYCHAPLAIIDELHECDDQRLKDKVLTDLLNRRYNAMVSTLLISNQTPAEFKATTSDSILSRIAERGGIVPCEWGSWREGERKPLMRHALTVTIPEAGNVVSFKPATRKTP